MFLLSCIQEAEKLQCHLFISASSLSFYRFLINATFFSLGLCIESAVASLAYLVSSSGDSAVYVTASFGTILLV